MLTFLPLEINTLFFLFYEGNEDEIEDMDDERLDEDEIESTGGQRSNDDASESGGKEK